MRTRFTEIFGVEHPGVQGGTIRVGRVEFVATVAETAVAGRPSDIVGADRAVRA